MATIEGADLYLRYTTIRGQSHVQQHRVWDAARFFAAQVKQHGPGDKKKPEELVIVTYATAAEYAAERRASRQ